MFWDENKTISIAALFGIFFIAQKCDNFLETERKNSNFSNLFFLTLTLLMIDGFEICFFKNTIAQSNLAK